MHDPVLLSSKILDRITKDGQVTYSQLEARAVEKNIPIALFESAMARVHKHKTLLMKTSVGTADSGEITYSIKPVVISSQMSHVQWCSDNYPRPGVDGVPPFVMPFPEIDMSHIFLSPEEMQAFKAELKGQRFIKKKAYLYARR
jgi:hypothetical protein